MLKRSVPSLNGEISSSLSRIDKEILKILLNPDGKLASQILSQKLGIPLTTIQRRRKHLEEEFLVFILAHLILKNLAGDASDLLISTRSGKTDSIANQLLLNQEVTYVGKSIGEHTIDLRAEIVVKDNSELLDVLEKVKAMEGVNDVIWSEIVHVMGTKMSVPSHIIDKL